MCDEYLYELNDIAEILRAAEYAVFFGGAGVSTDSGIPDFRGASGIYRSDGEESEYLLSAACMISEPDKFFSFFKNNMLYPFAEPNDAHIALARMEESGIIKSVITQNIDSLHPKAGSRRVIELHGTASRAYCQHCGKIYSTEHIIGTAVPRCTECASIVRPDIVLYGESVDTSVFSDAEDEISRADVLLVGGSSLTVNPAASLIDSFQGEHLIIINYTPTQYDGLAEYVIRASVSHILGELAERVEDDI